MSSAPATPEEVAYSPASFLTRVASAAIDFIILLAISVPLAPVMMVVFSIWPIGIAFSILYVALFDSSRFQGTPGKIILGMRVTDLKGRRISLRRAVWRGIAHYLIVLPPILIVVSLLLIMGGDRQARDGVVALGVLLGLLLVVAGYLMVLFTRDKQTIYDMFAGTLVLKKRTSEAEREASAVKIVR